MAHSVTGPQAKILEAMWWWLDSGPKAAPLTTFLNDSLRAGVPHKYRLFDGSMMFSGNVMANECPALLIEPIGGDEQPIHDLSQLGGGVEGVVEGLWSLTLMGYLNSLKFDEINTFYFLALEAFCAGVPTMWAVPSQGFLQGQDQLIQSWRPDWINPGALWLNTADLDNSKNRPSVSFFAFQFTLFLNNVR